MNSSRATNLTFPWRALFCGSGSQYGVLFIVVGQFCLNCKFGDLGAHDVGVKSKFCLQPIPIVSSLIGGLQCSSLLKISVAQKSMNILAKEEIHCYWNP